MNTVAILLAAGASSRLGRVKALLPLEDERPAVEVLAGRYAAHAGRCLVVTGYHAERIEPLLAVLPGVESVRNPRPERGQLSSLQCALVFLAAEAEAPAWFLFAPVDCFDIDHRVLGPLLAQLPLLDAGTLLCIPESGGKRGHPVAARWQVAAEFLALDESATARDIVHRLHPRSRFLPMTDAAFLHDVDTPADWLQRQSAARRRRELRSRP